MKNLRTTLLAAILLTSNGITLVASQTAQSLFYEQQTTTAAAILASTQSSPTTYTSRSTTSTSSPSKVISKSGSSMSEEEQKQVTELAKKEWSPKTLSKGQQKIAQELAKILDSLPPELILLIAHYTYMFVGTCIRTVGGELGSSRILAILPDNRTVLGVSRGSIKIGNLTTGNWERNTFEGHTGTINCELLLPTDRIALGGTEIQLWNLTTGKQEKTFNWEPTSKVSWILCLLLLPDGKVASGHQDGKIRIWNLTTGKSECTLKGHTYENGNTYGVRCLISSSDNTIISGGEDGKIKLWNLTTGDCEQTFKGYESSVIWLVQLPNDRIAALGETYLPRTSLGKGSIKVWNLDTSRCEGILDKDIYDAHTSAPSVVLPDGRLVSGGNMLRGEINIWNLITGRLDYTLQHLYQTTFLMLLPNNKLVSGNRVDIKVWE